ncbi:MAG: nucleotidyltransferase domain-containing protein [Comamonadaceae bacterium]
MTREQEILQQIKAICSNNHQLLGNRRVVLFGSRAHGTAKPRSDFDIGVCGVSAMPFEDFYTLADQIDAIATLYQIDWVDLNRTDQQFRQTALSNAKVIYEA